MSHLIMYTEDAPGGLLFFQNPSESAKGVLLRTLVMWCWLYRLPGVCKIDGCILLNLHCIAGLKSSMV